MKLWDLPLDRLIREWNKLDEGFTNIAAIRWLCLNDRYYLLVRACSRQDALHPWLLARCREVERNPDGHLDLWAREHYKSTIITFAGSIQEILKDPEITIAIFSHTRPIARKFWGQIKQEFESNEVLKRVFPDILFKKPEKESTRWSEEKGICVNRKGNIREATLEAWGLVDGQPTGAHFRLMIYDDVMTQESVNTPDQIAKTTAAWELSDNLGMAGGRKWHIGTRYSFADTYQAILDRKSVIPRIYPATADGTADGNPVFFDPDVWEAKKRDQGPATIACQMLQNPIAGQQALFRVEWLQIFEVRPETINVYIMVDPARSNKKDSAKTAMAVIGVDYARNKYLLDGLNHRMDLKERWEGMRALYRRWLNQPGVQNVQVGYESFGAQADLDYFHERMDVEGIVFPIEELAWPREGLGSKVDRVQRLIPDFRNGRFFIPYDTDDRRLTSTQKRVQQEGSPYRIARPIQQKDAQGNLYDVKKDFLEQVHYFPFGGLKDLIDATSRVYDMDVQAPLVMEEQDLEPAATVD